MNNLCSQNAFIAFHQNQNGQEMTHHFRFRFSFRFVFINGKTFLMAEIVKKMDFITEIEMYQKKYLAYMVLEIQV